jgi:hypothetical protein
VKPSFSVGAIENLFLIFPLAWLIRIVKAVSPILVFSWTEVLKYYAGIIIFVGLIYLFMI